MVMQKFRPVSVLRVISFNYKLWHFIDIYSFVAKHLSYHLRKSGSNSEESFHAVIEDHAKN
jgi:hypothetical protein